MALPKRAESEAPPERRLRLASQTGAEGEAFEERQLAEQVHRLRLAFLECRTIGHAWKLGYIGPAARADAELANRARSHPWSPDGARVLVCSRCRTERVDLCLVGYGRAAYGYRMVYRFYRYPDDYKLDGVLHGRDVLHEELFRRAFEPTTKETK